MDLGRFDVIVVGCGFYGATVAERCASALGKRVLIIDRRSHIGGNSYSETEKTTGIEVHRYGAHLFHTPNKMVWEYVTQFSQFNNYKHHVYSLHKGQVYPMPINLGTICQYFNGRLSPKDAQKLVATHAQELAGRAPCNLEEKAISLIGRPLYEAFVRGYSAKQWQMDPKRLPQSIINRLPVRYTFDNRYFSDPYEGLPTAGYTAVFEKMLAHPLITIQTELDFFDIRDQLPDDTLLVYTGPIDRFFDHCAGKLSWRSLDFEWEVVPVEDFQGTSVMNYADEDVPFTRIIEFKHLYPERKYSRNKTIIAREFSKWSGRNDEPFYPVDAVEDKKIYSVYRELGKGCRNVLFGGRLGTYKYIDMHQAIGSALRDFETFIQPSFTFDGALAGGVLQARKEASFVQGEAVG